MMAAVSGLVAILGHIFPVWLKLKGGRGVATGVGVVAALDWRVAAAAVAVWAVVLLAARYMAVASVAASLTVPAAHLWLEPQPWDLRIPITILFLLAPLAITLRHIPNFKRMAAGTEDRLWAKKSS
jgi:glycerol-3-phosphate acyltransferase PlsY